MKCKEDNGEASDELDEQDDELDGIPTLSGVTYVGP